MTLKEVRHVLGAKAKLVCPDRGHATDAGARVVIEGRVARFEMRGKVCMEATQRNGLFEMETVERRRAFLAVKAAGVKRVGEVARKRPVIEEANESGEEDGGEGH